MIQFRMYPAAIRPDSRNRGIRTGLRYPHGFANLLPKPGSFRAIG
jgi:hypothetical protein